MLKDYFEVRDWLEGFIPLVYGKEELGLERIKYLLGLLGNPQNKFKSIHIAGTSGKGSTAFYTAKLLESSNFSRNHLSPAVSDQGGTLKNSKVGLHISPHLVYIGERMQIFSSSVILTLSETNGEGSQKRDSSSTTQNDKSSSGPISVQGLVKLMNRIKPVVEKIQKEKPELTPSYFEILVAASFLYFAQEKVDYAVVEVGLGGRLDATNVLTPEVSVITNIGLDHTELLGNTIEAIAKEKAGIIKQGVSVVTGAEGKALEVIKQVAKSVSSDLYHVSRSKSYDLRFKIYEKLNLEKYCTLDTFLLVTKVAEMMGKKVDEKIIEKVFNQSFPGRFEEIEKGVVVDGAHNPDKVRALLEFVRKWKVESGKWKVNGIILVIAFKKGKKWKKMVDLLLGNLPVTKVIATEFQAVTDIGKFGNVKAEEIAHYVSKVKSVQCKVYSQSHEAVMEALISDVILTLSEANGEGSHNRDSSSATQNDNKSLVLITGSLYLVGEVRTVWNLPEF